MHCDFWAHTPGKAGQDAHERFVESVNGFRGSTPLPWDIFATSPAAATRSLQLQA